MVFLKTDSEASQALLRLLHSKGCQEKLVCNKSKTSEFTELRIIPEIPGSLGVVVGP